jgi:hypothetical protein
MNMTAFKQLPTHHRNARPFRLTQRLLLTGLLLGGSALASLAACAPPPDGLVGWWRAEGDAANMAGTNQGALQGQTTYGSGPVGQCFVFDGNGDGVLSGAPARYQLQDFTIEAWVKRNSLAQVTANAWSDAVVVGYGGGGYGLGMDPTGRPWLSRIDVDAVFAPALFTNTSWHHLAVTKSGSTVVFYVDGIAYPAPTAYTTVFTFTSDLAIGARGDNLVSSFLGSVDEPSIYERPLVGAEIQAIYNAGVSGKCFTGAAPQITLQPASRTVVAGDPAQFTVSAGGTAPLSYQWTREGTNVAGATGTQLSLAEVSTAQAGNYAAVVANSFGAVTSLTAVLTVVPPPPCTNPPASLVGWWKASQDTLDTAGSSHGTLAGNAGFAAGKVGQAFSLDGSGDAVRLGRPASLQLQDFTIEAWLKRSSANTGEGAILCYGQGGYGLGMDGTGRLYITRTGIDGLFCITTIADTGWHHVALTKSGSAVVFYVDGTPYPATTAFNAVFTFTTDVAIGARGDNLASSFNGLLDEVSLYARALSTDEIQAIYAANSGGKCVVPAAPLIGTQPANQSVVAGSSVAFTVGVGGTRPFAYQWSWNGSNLAGATASSLMLTNVQSAQSGNYAVTVTNAIGSATSSNALLSITFPSAAVRAVATSGMAGGLVTVPVEIRANGNENALQFSLNYLPSLLTYTGVELGTNFSDATLFVNTSLTAGGRLGIILALPTGATMPAGVQEVVRVTFDTAVRTTPITSPISFGDAPTVRQLVNAQAGTLSATYSQAIVSLAASILEADVNPRPSGDKSVTVADWVLLGLYAARLDYPTNASEFQRADCAPRSTFGDGGIKVTDWVQAGRYAGGADPLTIIGGPTEELPPGRAGRLPKDGSDRRVLIGNGSWFPGQTGVVAVVLEAQGNESALGFSLAFDPALFSYVSAVKGTSSSSATLNVNTTQAAAGKVGIALALSSGTFPAGGREVIKLSLRSRPDAPASPAPVSFADLPVPREVSDATALPLTANYVNGAITIYPRPTIQIARSGATVSLSWPLAASNFTVKAASTLNGGGWVNAPGTPVIVNGRYTLVLPAAEQTMFYRLFTP